MEPRAPTGKRRACTNVEKRLATVQASLSVRTELRVVRRVATARVSVTAFASSNAPFLTWRPLIAVSVVSPVSVKLHVPEHAIEVLGGEDRVADRARRSFLPARRRNRVERHLHRLVAVGRVGLRLGVELLLVLRVPVAPAPVSLLGGTPPKVMYAPSAAGPAASMNACS